MKKLFLACMLICGIVPSVNGAEIAHIARDCFNQDADELYMHQFLTEYGYDFVCIDPTVIKNAPDLTPYKIFVSRMDGLWPSEFNDVVILDALKVAIENGSYLYTEFWAQHLAAMLGVGSFNLQSGWIGGSSSAISLGSAYYMEPLSDSFVTSDLPVWMPSVDEEPMVNQLIVSHHAPEAESGYPRFAFNPDLIENRVEYNAMFVDGYWIQTKPTSPWCAENPGICNSAKTVYSAFDMPFDYYETFGFSWVQYGDGRIFRGGLLFGNMYTAAHLTFGPIADQMRKKVIDEALAPVSETALVTISLATSVDADGTSNFQIHGDVKLTYGAHGEFSELCSQETSNNTGICEVEIPIGNTVVLERLNETRSDIECFIGDVIIPHLGTFPVAYDFALACRIVDNITVTLQFPRHDNHARGEIRTLVKHGVDTTICSTTSQPRTCSFVIEKGDHFSFSKIGGNASYSIPGRPKNLEENVDLEITEDAIIYVSNADVVVTVHGFASSVSGEMVCNSLPQLLLLSVLPHVTLEDLSSSDEWYQFVDSMVSMRDNLRKQGFQVFEFNYDWRQDLFVTAQTLEIFLKDLHRKFSKKTHLVAHSMGGLVTRLLIQYGDPQRVQSAVFIGTPHAGSVDAVYLRGGNFKSWTGSLTAVLKEEALLDLMKTGCNFDGEDYEYVRQYIPSSVYLLPTEPYFAYNVKKAKDGAPIVLDVMCDRNYVLEELNVNADQLISSGIPMKIFASLNKPTILHVSNPGNPAIAKGCDPNQRWLDGEPEDRHRPAKSGDGTVPFDSAYPERIIPVFENILLEAVKGKHMDLPENEDVINALVKFFQENGIH